MFRKHQITILAIAAILAAGLAAPVYARSGTPGAITPEPPGAVAPEESALPVRCCLFVNSIAPSYGVTQWGYLIEARVAIRGLSLIPEGVPVGGAKVTLAVTMPVDGPVPIALPVPPPPPQNMTATTDADGIALFRFLSWVPGTYHFEVIGVRHAAWKYAPNLNLETSDTLTIPSICPCVRPGA